MEAKKSPDVPVTRKMLETSENRLSHKITSLALETRAGFKLMGAKLETVLEKVSQTQLVVENQRADNNYVLDGHSSLFHGHEDLKDRISKLEENVFGIKQK